MRTTTSMPKDWVSSPFTKWLIDNNVSLHKLTTQGKLSPQCVYSIVRGQTLNPRADTIKKICAFTGLSRRQFSWHMRAVREMRAAVDQSVVASGTIQRVKATKPSSNASSHDELVVAIQSLEETIRKAFRV